MMGRKKHLRRKRPWEFKKILAVWAAFIATGTVIASYVLAAFDKQTNSDLAVAIFGACVGYLISYAAASVSEKVSRNRHSLDADGNPIARETVSAEDDHPKNARHPYHIVHTDNTSNVYGWVDAADIGGNNLSVEAVAKEVIAGKWGNGDERKQRLTAAGYDYAAVQAQVNKMI